MGGFPVDAALARGPDSFEVESIDISALTRFEAGIGLANHEDLATAADDFAVAVTVLRRFQGGQDLHDRPRQLMKKYGMKTSRRL